VTKLYLFTNAAQENFDLREEFRTGTFMILIGYLMLLEQIMKIQAGSSHMELCKCYIIW
jgi:hypothetical protein